MTRYQVGDLTACNVGDPWFDDEDAAIKAAHEMDETVTWERPVGVWREDGNDMELVYIVYLGTLWKPA